ncbi:hypothetical protein BH10BAC2_BH10BAC2_46550 [soil metagenome]
MNIQNIAALADQLELLGFENGSCSLLKRICFKPDNFLLSQKILKGNDQVNFQLFYERDNKQNTYTLKHYDATLQQGMALQYSIIKGINTAALEKRMSETDWKDAFDFDIKKQWSAEDKASWDKEQKIELIVEDLLSLEATEEGNVIATGLKLKFWAGIPCQELIGNISPLKNKTEVSQRFYFFEGQTGISVDEAYRFLQNKWLEKHMQLKRKQTDSTNKDEFANTEQASSGNGGLLKKKHFSRSKTGKSNKLNKN